MKTLRTLFTMMLLVAASSMSADTWQDPVTYVNYTFILGTSEASVASGGLKNYYPFAGSPDVSGNVVIRPKITVNGKDYTVTSIGDYAFYNCKLITSITIPSTITSTGYQSFYGCREITNITLPSSMTTIGEYTFGYCDNLESITIPASVTSIGRIAFFRCIGLTSMSVEEGNKVYDSRDNCNAIIETSTNTLIHGCQNTTIPKSVTSIGARVFNGCTGLTSIAIPSKVTSIGDAAFFACENLKSVTCLIRNPFEIDEAVFQISNIPYEFTSATLYVPTGTKEKYQSTMCWNLFNKIVEIDVPEEIDDVATLSNTIYMDDVKVKAGTETALPIKMKNTADIRGFQFTLDLPDGVTPVKSAKGKIQASLSSGRLPEGDEHTLSVSENEDGTLLFTANSLYEEAFTGNDGEVLTLRVNVASDMADGDYDIVVKDIRLNEKDATKYYDVTKVKSTLTVWSYTLGDVNGDGEITVSDYIGVGNRIHNVAQEGFNEKAADVVADGAINISDYVGVANLILTGNIHGTTAGARRSVKKANTDVSTIDNVLYVEPFTAEAGQQAVLSVKMKNKAEIRGFQFDLTLPEGVKAAKGSNGRIQAKLAASRLPEEDEHTLMVTEQADGTLRFLCGSEYMETFTGNDGEILTLTLDIAADIANGEHAIILSNIKLGENDMNVSYSTDSVETTLTIGSGEPGPEPEPEHKNGEKWGDVNNDNVVDVADIATIISIMAANARLQMELAE